MSDLSMTTVEPRTDFIIECDKARALSVRSCMETVGISYGVYRDLFNAMVAYSKQRLMTTFFNYENPEFPGISFCMPDFPVSSIVNNLILLSLVETNSTLHRCISVVKSRRSKHSFDTRDLLRGRSGTSSMTPRRPDRYRREPAFPVRRRFPVFLGVRYRMRNQPGKTARSSSMGWRK